MQSSGFSASLTAIGYAAVNAFSLCDWCFLGGEGGGHVEKGSDLHSTTPLPQLSFAFQGMMNNLLLLFPYANVTAFNKINEFNEPG